ncbi:hypothetical protein Ahy_A04g018768 [Arachis hypogaea]|uniref:Uncharacterized protein n=1 Tax=Arachis hypogaea TaxID=3818 RepID=A0A445DEH4_ARAHY|nr:hypothetical protein Ahy_A04g018768 [Arachis hypogaea]
MAKVLARGVDCDIALLSVESDEFWRDVEPLRLGRLLHLQDSVTVVGYPLGGDTISVTKGVVSRIEATTVAQHSMTKGSALVWLTSSLLADGLAVVVQKILACAFAEKNFDKVTAEGSKEEKKAGN